MTDLQELAAGVERPDDDVRQQALDLIGPVRAQGRLGGLAAWLAAAEGRVPATGPARPRLVVVGAAIPERSGRLAADLGVAVRLAGVGGTAGPAVAEADACTPDEATAALLDGARIADDEADAGTDLLLLAVPDAALAVPVATLVGLLTRSDASLVTATGQPDADWMLACAAARDAMRRGRRVLADQVALLAAVGGQDLATATGLLLRAAARRTPVLLDGPATAAAALVASRLSFRAPGWWLAGHLSPDPAHLVALERLSLDPVLDLGLRSDDGTGALLAVPVLRAAVG